jgi:hypothetical protein
MADTTTRYTLPYQETTDPPDGASLGQDLAEAVDGALGTVEDALDARLDALEADTLDARIDVLEGRAVGSTFANSNASATSGTTELAIDQVTATLVNGRTYKIEWTLTWSGTVTDDQFFVLLRLGSGIAGTQLTFRTVAIGRSFGAHMRAYYTASSSGSQTFTGSLRRSTGTGTMTATGSATQNRILTVERMT